jgi:hypothetical protein
MKINLQGQPSVEKESPNQSGFNESDFSPFVALLANA